MDMFSVRPVCQRKNQTFYLVDCKDILLLLGRDSAPPHPKKDLTLTCISNLQGPLVRWLKVNFSEAFIAWIHIKALRVFVESVLRSRDHEYRLHFTHTYNYK